ncbi:hypothetical protein Pelo_3316 [Pelomyxa schiedti]|nr:hypothetical protein Pelo_3316 [Pelomyxa schiedti]
MDGIITVVAIHSHMDARSQFIAIGAGVIVGRTSRSRCRQPWGSSEPAVDSFRRTEAENGREFHGWVGPESAGKRFAVTSVPKSGLAEVIDTERPGWCVVATLSSSNYSKFSISRRWGVVMPVRWGHAVTLWDFGSIGSGGEVASVTEISLPWDVDNMAFDGDCSLVVAKSNVGVMVVDLQATMEQRKLVGRDVPLCIEMGRYIREMWCWKGMAYATATREEGFLFCLTTGQKIELTEIGGKVLPIGGEFFVNSKEAETDLVTAMRVFSVRDPTQLCCTHGVGRMCSLHAGHGVVARESYGGPMEVQVVDAASGIPILTITPELGLVDRVF